MARPTKNDIDSGIQGWDGKMDDNDEVILNAPFPMHEHTGDESDIQATFPAASYDRSHVMVNHTTLGWSLYVSDGTAWNRIWSVTTIATIAALTSAFGTGNDVMADVGVAFNQATLNDNFRDLVDKIEEIRSALVNHGLIT